MSDAQPRTLRSRPRPKEEDEDGNGALPPSTDSDDASDPLTDAQLPPVLGGWSQGQKEMDSTSTFAQAFKPDADIQIIKFLDDAPYANYRRHWIERMGQNGSYKRPYTCLGTVQMECPICSVGDRPQAVSSFNIVVIGDENQLTLKSWDVGARLFNTLKGYAQDARIGPLTKGYFAVNKTGKGGQGGTVSVNVAPIGPAAAREDYNIEAPKPEAIKAVGKYDSTIVEIPKVADLKEIAAEMADYD